MKTGLVLFSALSQETLQINHKFILSSSPVFVILTLVGLTPNWLLTVLIKPMGLTQRSDHFNLLFSSTGVCRHVRVQNKKLMFIQN